TTTATTSSPASSATTSRTTRRRCAAEAVGAGAGPGPPCGPMRRGAFRDDRDICRAGRAVTMEAPRPPQGVPMAQSDLVFYVKCRVRPDRIDEWRQAVDQIIEQMSAEDSFVSCHLHRDAGDPTLFTLYE